MMATNPSGNPQIVPAEDLNVNATSGALQHAADLGVDITKIVGTGKDGKITRGDVQAAVDARDAAKEVPVKGRYYYSLEENHPGAPSFQTQPLSVKRIFQWEGDPDACPEFEGRQINAVPCEGPDIPPEFVQDLQARFGH